MFQMFQCVSVISTNKNLINMPRQRYVQTIYDVMAKLWGTTLHGITTLGSPYWVVVAFSLMSNNFEPESGKANFESPFRTMIKMKGEGFFSGIKYLCCQ